MGRYSTFGRILGALDAVALAGVGAYKLLTPAAGGGQAAIGLCIYTICVSPLLFVVEMPTLCKCFKFCNILTRYTKWIAGTWILRAVLYILIAAGAFAIYVVSALLPGRVPALRVLDNRLEGTRSNASSAQGYGLVKLIVFAFAECP